MRPIITILCLLMLTSAGVAPAAAASASADVDESLAYEWRLEGFLGAIARLMFPGRGEGLITAKSTTGGLLETELQITSSKSDKGEFWLYGAEVDTETGSTREVWNAYRHGDKDRDKRATVEEEGVIDIASGIYMIRQNPPTAPRPMKIWSDGKIYPVVVVPGEWRERELANGDEVRARVYRVRADKSVSGQGEWKGRLDIWLAPDDRATPVEILVERLSMKVRMRLAETVDGG